MDDPLALAERYLLAVRRGETGHEAAAGLAELPRQRLRTALSTDDDRLTFWTNLYNATAQSVLGADPGVFEARTSFFGAPLARVSGQRLSLDDIEHGLLRRSRPKWGLGYVTHPAPGAFERAFRVEQPDPRIHFALNCGAASCPPIAAYEVDRIDAQLDRATRGYLETETTYDPEEGVVTVPKLLSWYRGDFGGKRGTVRFLREHDVIPADATPDVAYAPYDWSPEVGRFRALSEW